MGMTWGDHSRKVITAALESGQKQGLAGKDLERHVQAQYPYGERAMWPYKAWCKAFNDLVMGKGKRSKPTQDLPGQSKLF